jgi:hypothetical protein
MRVRGTLPGVLALAGLCVTGSVLANDADPSSPAVTAEGGSSAKSSSAGSGNLEEIRRRRRQRSQTGSSRGTRSCVLTPAEDVQDPVRTDGHILMAVESKRNRIRLDCCAGLNVPHRPTSGRIQCEDIALIGLVMAEGSRAL